MEISNSELAARMESGFTRIERTIDQVHSRFDAHDKRINDHDIRLARKAVILDTLQAQQAAAKRKPEDSKAITRWDLTVFGAAVYLLLEVLPKVLK